MSVGHSISYCCNYFGGEWKGSLETSAHQLSGFVMWCVCVCISQSQSNTQYVKIALIGDVGPG